MYAQWIADLNLDPLSRFDSYMRAKVRQLYISLFHAYARKNNMWILNHGEALQNADPLQPALGTGLIHCAPARLANINIKFSRSLARLYIYI